MRWPWFRRNRATTAPPSITATAPGAPSIVLGGRRMAIDAPYMLPKNQEERRRLDVDCGTGRWGADMARQFPNANVVGLDLVPPAAHIAAMQADFERLSGCTQPFSIAFGQKA